MARRFVDVMALLSANGNRQKTGCHVVDASIEDGVSATLMEGGVIYRHSHPSLLIRHLLLSRQAPRHM